MDYDKTCSSPLSPTATPSNISPPVGRNRFIDLDFLYIPIFSLYIAWNMCFYCTYVFNDPSEPCSYEVYVLAFPN